jgi:hypothetical protein
MAKRIKKSIEEKAKGKKKLDEFKCQICGRKSDNPVEAMTHLLDHGSSALESVSKLIKDQKEGRVSKSDRERLKEKYDQQMEKREVMEVKV